jgi:hypothetical protein
MSGVVGSSELSPVGAVTDIVDFIELDAVVASDDPEFVVADQSVELSSAFEGTARSELVECRGE